MAEITTELKRSVSDVSDQLGKLREGLEIDIANTKMALSTEQTECECCGIKEECTSEYVSQVKCTHLGRWVCGLCAEAVKERLERGPTLAMYEAVNSHRRFCEEFNTTTRLNPKLSLTCAMRDIVRKSSVQRTSKTGDVSSCGMKLARTTSRVPRVNG